MDKLTTNNVILNWYLLSVIHIPLVDASHATLGEEWYWSHLYCLDDLQAYKTFSELMLHDSSSSQLIQLNPSTQKAKGPHHLKELYRNTKPAIFLRIQA